MWDSHLCGRGRYVGFVPASSIFPEFSGGFRGVKGAMPPSPKTPEVALCPNELYSLTVANDVN